MIKWSFVVVRYKKLHRRKGKRCILWKFYKQKYSVIVGFCIIFSQIDLLNIDPFVMLQNYQNCVHINILKWLFIKIRCRILWFLHIRVNMVSKVTNHNLRKIFKVIFFVTCFGMRKIGTSYVYSYINVLFFRWSLKRNNW